MSVTLYRPYCTLRDVQRETHNTDDVDESWFRECINRASRIVESKTSRVFYAKDFSVTPYLVPRRDVYQKVIYLAWPIITLTEVDERGDDDTENIVDLEDYGFTVGDRSIHCVRNWEFINFKDTIKIKGTFGFPDDPTADDPTQVPSLGIPDELRRATALIAAAISAENRREVMGLDGGVVEVSDHNIPAEAMKLLVGSTKHVV